MVTIYVKCEANNILVLHIIFVPPSSNTQVTPTNGHYKAIFASIMLLFYWFVLTLHKKISLSIVAPILGPTMVVWNPFSLTWHIYNGMMMRPMMRHATKIKLMKLTLLIWGACDHGWGWLLWQCRCARRFFHPVDWALARLHKKMAKITIKCGKGASIKLCNHATSLLQRVPSNIWAIHLARVNESMHLGMVFHRVDDGFKNFVIYMKVWHKTMMEHFDTHKKRTKE